MDRSHRRWIVASAILCAGLIYVYPLALSTPLLDPDEGLHAAISQEMAESDDFVTPRFLHEPFLDKPILYFAAQAWSLRMFGMNEAAVRAPGLMFALLGAVTTALLARRLFDGTTGLIALLVALTSVIPLALAQAAAHDVALVPWTNLLLLCWWGAIHDETRGRRAANVLAAALFVALALLTKGLIGIAVVGVGFAAYVAIVRERVVAAAICVATSLALGLLVASPWFVAMELQSPGYLHYYFIERHLQGYVTNTQQHGLAPWYFYLPLMLGGTAPWMLYIVPGFWQSWVDRRRGLRIAGRPTVFLLCWLLGGTVFLTTASSKLITYALPLFPAIAILVADAIRRYLAGELTPTIEKAFTRTLGACCAAGCFVPWALLIGLDRYIGSQSPPAAYALAAVAGAVSFAAVALLYRRQPAPAIAVGAAWYGVVFVVVMSWPMQAIAERFSQRALAHQLATGAPLPEHIVLTGARVASIVFYLDPEQRRGLHAGQISQSEMSPIHRWNAVPKGTLLVVPRGAWDRWPNPIMLQAAHQRGLAGDLLMLTPDEPIPHTAQAPTSRSW